MSISPDAFGDLLGDAPLAVLHPVVAAPAGLQELSDLRASAHLLHATARE
jgi:hypothetical protein